MLNQLAVRGRLAAAGFAVTGLLLGHAALAQTPAPGSTPTLEKVSLSVGHNTASGPLFIAKDKGYFQDVGLDVDIKIFDAAQDAVLAVASGGTEFGPTALSASFYNIAAKGGLKMVAGFIKDLPGHHDTGLIVRNAAYDAGFKTVHDLKGKRIGVTTTGGGAYYALARIAEKYGSSIDDINVVPLQSVSNMVAALKGGQVDAIFAGAPVPSMMEADHAGHVIAYSGDEVPSQFGVAMVNTAYLNGHRTEVANFLKAFQKGCAEYNAAFNQLDTKGNLVKGPNYDQDLAIIAKYLGVSPDSLTTWPFIDPTIMLDANDIKTQIAFWKAHKMVDPSVDAAAVIDTSFGYVQ